MYFFLGILSVSHPSPSHYLFFIPQNKLDDLLGLFQQRFLSLCNPLPFLVLTQLRFLFRSPVEVVHEALIRNWGELREWMNTDRVFRAWQERLRAAKKQWEATNKDRGSLLRGVALAEAEEKLEERPEDLISEKAFIQQSIQERDRAQKAKQRSRNRIIQALSSGFALVSVAAGVATWQWCNAERQSQMAFARQLAATSEWMRSQRANLNEPSILVALESLKILQRFNESPLEADLALRNGLELLPEYIALISHEGTVWEVKFSPNGEYVATASDDGMAKLNLTDTYKLVEKSCQSLIQNLSINNWKRYMDNEPYRKTCNKLPLHPSFLKEGRALAQQGKRSEALSIYKRAKKLEPGIDLIPETETIDQEPKVVVNKFFAPTKLKQGEKLAKEGKISKAISTHKKAQKLDPNLEINARSWNQLCRFGSIYRHAEQVLFACEKAVELAPNEPWHLDSRGLARALTGDRQGAIEDFQAFVDSPEFDEEYRNKRQQWIEALKKGEDPFTDEVLEELKKE